MASSRSTLTCFLLPLLAIFLSPASAVSADTDKELETLRMFYDEGDLAVSVTRAQLPLSRTAENITVVTAADIEEMNAHTLAEVLAHVPGFFIDEGGAPGSIANLVTQGFVFKHILFLMDGVRLNNIPDNALDPGTIPVQHIERVEILRGSASSTWGPALGGVVNIVTKDPSQTVSGTVSASAGSGSFGDYRAEVRGALPGGGYYLTGGALLSRGILPGNDITRSGGYGKLQWDLNPFTTATWTMWVNDSQREMGDRAVFSNPDHPFSALTALTVTSSLSAGLETEFSARYVQNRITQQFAMPGAFVDTRSREYTLGATAKILWKTGSHSLATGIDADHGFVRATKSVNGADAVSLDGNLDRWGTFVTDTIAVGRSSFTPSLRLDHANTTGYAFSPSLGVAAPLGDATVLRLFVGRGYTLPALSSATNNEKVVSLQAAAETTILPAVRLKATLFRNRLFDVRPSPDDPLHQNSVLNQGGEAEIQTVPWHGVSVSGSYTYTDSLMRPHHDRVAGIPTNAWLIGLHYDDGTFRGLLSGKYIWWNEAAASGARYRDFIWDLTLSARLPKVEGITPELFLSLHNLFNGEQYDLVLYKNAGRWAEAGVRLAF